MSNDATTESTETVADATETVEVKETVVEETPVIEAKETEKEEKPEEVKPEKDSETNDLDELQAQVARWRSSSRRHEDRIKAILSEKQEVESSRLTLEGELHKTKTELAKLQKDLRAGEVASLKTKAASEYQLPEGALKYLTGSTEEEIATSASELASTFGVKSLQKKIISTQGTASQNKSDLPEHQAALQQWIATRNG